MPQVSIRQPEASSSAFKLSLAGNLIIKLNAIKVTEGHLFFFGPICEACKTKCIKH